MKQLLMATGFFFSLLLPAIASAACEDVKADIQQRILNNGVAAEQFTLEVVPADNTVTTGKIVGNCENNAYNIIYTRH